MPTTTPTIWLAPVKVNTTDTSLAGNDQTKSQVVALADGRFFVAWQDNTDPLGIGSPDIFGRFVGPEGTFGGNDFLMNSFVDYPQGPPAIARGPDGGVNLVYQTTSDPLFNAGEGVPIDRFDANGTIMFNPGNSWINEAEDETAPTIASFSDGSSVVVFEDNSVGDKDLRFRIVDATGTIGAEFDVATGVGDQAAPDVAVLTATSFVTAFITGSGGNHNVEFAIRNSNGTPVVAGVVDSDAADETDPSVAVLKGGSFVVVWTDSAADASGTAVMARIYTAAGVPLPARPVGFVVPTTLAGDQKTPTITALADGGFVVIWDDDASGSIRGMRFDATGTVVGNEFIVSALPDVSDPDATLLDDGRIAVSFTSTVGSNSDIYLTIFDPRSSPIEGTAGDDVFTSRLDGATVYGRAGIDTLLGQAGVDVLWGGNDGDFLFGGAGNDVLYGEAGNDELTGGADNDTLYGGTGDDKMTGGTGNDTFYVDSALDTVLEGVGGGFDVIVSTVSLILTVAQDIERLATMSVAGVTAINFTGNALNNQLYGNNGNNVLNGGLGNDNMYGYAGNDTFYINSAADFAFEAVGGGYDVVLTSVSYTLVAGQEIERLTTTSVAAVTAINLNGNALNNQIYGNNGANIINGGAGNDVLTGYTGTDFFLFNTALNSATNRDVITDFNVANDTIRLENAIFTALAATGTLAANLFEDTSLAGQSGTEVIVYNRATGDLYYDTNGAAVAGGLVQFADVTNGTVLTNADFVVV